MASFYVTAFTDDTSTFCQAANLTFFFFLHLLFLFDFDVNHLLYIAYHVCHFRFLLFFFQFFWISEAGFRDFGADYPSGNSG